jgi:hypothetical protein
MTFTEVSTRHWPFMYLTIFTPPFVIYGVQLRISISSVSDLKYIIPHYNRNLTKTYLKLMTSQNIIIMVGLRKTGKQGLQVK